MISANKVSKSVSLQGAHFTILQPTDLQIAAGSSCAIVGPSGSGKSTLLALLAGLDSPSSGSVILNGVDITEMDEEARARFRREQVGFVFQNFQLMPTLTALENEPGTHRTLTLNNGDTHQVLFDLEQGGVEAVPEYPLSTPLSNPDDNTLYRLTIHLITVGA